MRAFTPEISWHNRLPALSLDISIPIDGTGNLYRLATGGNDCRVYIWLIDIGSSKLLTPSSNPDIRIRAGLRRHQKSVGVVRFSAQHMLASGDDDGYIYLWKHKIEEQHHQLTESNAFLNDDGFEDLELWQQQRVLRGHIEDICDLAWSKDGQFLLSGSVDNSAILWDTVKGAKVWCSDLIKGYVQGVALDPHSQYMAAISSDRTLRIYNFSDKRLLNATRRMNIKGKYKAFFCDDTVQTFCRRLEFSPDGQFLLAPTSRLLEREQKHPSTSGNKQSSAEQTDTTSKEIEVIGLDSSEEDTETKQNETQQTTKIPKKSFNVFLVFKRSSFNKPTHYYPTGREVALCARFSPVLYKLRDNETNFWKVPYRIVFAVVTSRSVLIYDSQQPTPIGYVSQIHLARLTDLTWSNDGRLLMVSSYDGYSTLLTFDQDEFGEIYTGPMMEPLIKSIADEDKVEGSSNENLNGKSGEEKPLKKGQKRAKTRKETVPTKKEKLNPDEVELEVEEQLKAEEKIKPPKKSTPKKITPTKLPESATMWRYIVKRT